MRANDINNMDSDREEKIVIRRDSFVIKEVPVEEDDGDGSTSSGSLSIEDMDVINNMDIDGGDSSQNVHLPGRNERRIGDKSCRMRQHRRASTGGMSVQESFGEMSLQSFTSLNSFTSASGGDQNEIGNLIFLTDEEVAKLMYSEKDNAKKGADEMDVSPPGVVGSRRNSDASTSSTLWSSLPPSAILGTGAFSTVRLAWRKTEKNTISNDSDDVVVPSSTFDMGQKVPSRRSIVHVQSKASDDPNAPLEHKGELVAVKILQKSILKQMKSIEKGANNRITVHTAFDDIEREIATMKRLRHPNLIRLFEVIDSVESDRLHMVLEFVSLGEILSHVEGTNKYRRMRYKKKVRGLTADGHFDEKHAALYFVDIMHGLAYLHRNRICHRDLKPENILLCANGIAKISDFGVAHMFEDELARESYLVTPLDDDSFDALLCPDHGATNNKESDIHLSKHESEEAYNMSARYDKGILKKTEGTWCFWSPEMCTSDEAMGGFSGYSADLWAAGVCLYIFTTGMLPFFSHFPSELFDLIAKAEVHYEGLGLSDQLKDLLSKLLTRDASTRAGVGDCLKHEFCANARLQRIDELGNKFRSSEKHIILSQNDVDQALSIATIHTQKHPKFLPKRKRFTAPPKAKSPFNIQPADDACTPSASRAKKKLPSKLEKWWQRRHT